MMMFKKDGLEFRYRSFFKLIEDEDASMFLGLTSLLISFPMAFYQLIPRTVWLDANGKQLLQWPIEELDSLRGKNIQMSNQQLKLGDRVEVNGIDASQVCNFFVLTPLEIICLPKLCSVAKDGNLCSHIVFVSIPIVFQVR